MVEGFGGPVEAAVEAPGGSPLNVAVGLARLGTPTMLLTHLGSDPHGRLIEEHLAASGVRLDSGSVVPGITTGTATARLDAAGSASYDLRVPWAPDLPDLGDTATGLHVGSLGTVLTPGRDRTLALAELAAGRRLFVSYDPNVRPGFLTQDAWAHTRALAALATLVKASDEDLRQLRPDCDPLTAAADLLRGRTRLVVVTFGGRGATALIAGTTVSVPSLDGPVVDTVGAGDSFMAALIAIALDHGLEDLDEQRLSAYLGAAHQVAAVTVSRRGADPPWRDELPAGWPAIDTRA